MSGYDNFHVNPETVSNFNGLADKAEEAKEAIEKSVDTCISIADGHTNTLGPHADSLIDALEEIKNAISGAAEPAETVAEALRNVADGYDEVISAGGLGGK